LKNIKIILLSPVVFDRYNNDLVEKVILKLDDKNSNNIFSNDEWEYLDSEDGYLKNIDGHLNIKDAILKERNLNPQMYKNLTKPFHTMYENYSLEINSNLIVNEKHNFLMFFEFNFKDLTFDNSNEFIKKLMNNRNVFHSTNNIDYYNNIKIKSMNIINNIIQKILKSSSSLITEKNFTIDSSYPLIFINGFNKNNTLSQLFSNEEDIEQRNTSSLIANEYENAFVHIGWNYGIVKDLPKNLSQKYLCMLIFLQLTYYLLRFYKGYFQKKIQNLSTQSIFNEEEIKNFDRLKILYHKEYLGYKTYKSGLYPNFYKEFTNIEILWHMEEDISFIEKTFEVQNEYMDKHFQLETDKTNRNLNYGIAIIGLIQIFAIYGIFNDYVSLKEDTNYASYLDYATISIVATISIIIVFITSIYIKSKAKK
jgi:hypothetical protein